MKGRLDVWLWSKEKYYADDEDLMLLVGDIKELKQKLATYEKFVEEVKPIVEFHVKARQLKQSDLWNEVYPNKE